MGIFDQLGLNMGSSDSDVLTAFRSLGSNNGPTRPQARPDNLNINGAGGGPGGIFGQLGGLDGVGDIAGIVGDLGGIYASLKGLGIAKDQLKFQKSSYNTNVENQTQTYNTALEDRTRARHKAERTSSADTDQYLAKNSL